jgi:hypothetical protein
MKEYYYSTHHGYHNDPSVPQFTPPPPKMKKKNENDGIGCPNKAILKQKPL